MDRYTKFVLTVIAVSLSVIAFKSLRPTDASAGVLSPGPTFGDVVALRDIKDPKAHADAQRRLLLSVPLVRVQGGFVDTSQ